MITVTGFGDILKIIYSFVLNFFFYFFRFKKERKNVSSMYSYDVRIAWMQLCQNSILMV